jgi:hypothetical protein
MLLTSGEGGNEAARFEDIPRYPSKMNCHSERSVSEVRNPILLSTN